MPEIHPISTRLSAAQESACGMRLHPILAKADAALSGARAETYGASGPEDSTGLICSLWSAYLSDALKTEIIISRREFCSMMVLLKVARDTRAPKEDNLVDIAGYAALAQPDADGESVYRRQSRQSLAQPDEVRP